MQEEVDAFSFAYGAVASECQRIDPVERQIVVAPEERLEFRDHAWAPRSGLLDVRHFAFEKPFLNVAHRARGFTPDRRA